MPGKRPSSAAVYCYWRFQLMPGRSQVPHEVHVTRCLLQTDCNFSHCLIVSKKRLQKVLLLAPPAEVGEPYTLDKLQDKKGSLQDTFKSLILCARAMSTASDSGCNLSFLCRPQQFSCRLCTATPAGLVLGRLSLTAPPADHRTTFHTECL